MRIALLRFSFLLLGVFLFFGCQTKLSREDFLQWVKNYENGLHVRQSFNGVVYDVQYLPTQARDYSIDSKELRLGLQHVTLRIASHDGSDILNRHATSPRDFQLNDYYYSYLFQQDIFLEQGNNVLPCVLFHFERTADQHNNRVFNLAFENEKDESEEFFLIIKSDRLSGLPVRIKFTRHALPEIKHDS